MHRNGQISPVRFLLILLPFILLGLASCDDAAVFPEAQNLITGTVDGTEYTAANVRAFRDSNQVFTISGRINEDAGFTIYYTNETVQEHPVQTAGNFVEFIETLDSLADVQPPISDSLILDSLATGLLALLESVDDPLAPDRSFAFYLIGDVIYFSVGGGLTVTSFDAENKRITGTLDIRLKNFLGGQKDWTAVIEDVRFFEQ